MANKLIFTISLILFFSSFVAGERVIAQTSDNSGDAIEEVVVTGIRGSLESAINIKQQAVNVVDSLSAEDIGDFGSENIADAIKRVPGIAIERDYFTGSGSVRATARGIGSTLNRVLLNGQSVATTGTQREFDYADLATELISGIDVYKSPQADLDEGSAGALINVRTRKPTQLHEKTIFAGSFSAGAHAHADHTDPSGSLIAGWKTDDGRLGVIASVAYRESTGRRDSIEIFSYVPINVDIGADGTIEFNNVLAPNGGGTALFLDEEKRLGITLAGEYIVSDSLSLQLNTLFSNRERTSINRNYLWQPHRAFDNAGDEVTNIIAGRVEKNTLVDATYGADVFAQYDGLYKPEQTSQTLTVDFSGEWNNGDNLSLSAHIGYTQAEDSIPEEYITNFQTAPPQIAPEKDVFDFSGGPTRVDISSGFPEISFSTDPFDLSKHRGPNYASDKKNNDDEEIYLQADMALALDVGVLDSIKFGIKQRSRNKNGNVYGDGEDRINTNGTLAGYVSDASGLDNFFNGKAPDRSFSNYPLMDVERLFREFQMPPLDVVDLPGTYRIDEDISAVYAMAVMEAERFRANAGLRLVQTRRESSGTSIFYYNDEYVEYVPVNFKNTSTEVLPSANLAYNLSDDIIARFSVARVIARPTFSDLKAGISFDDEYLTASGGNPNLDDFKATQLDLGAEWYHSQGGILSGILFYKDIDTFFVADTIPFNFEGRNYSLSAPINGDGGSAWGGEFIYQQNFTALPAPLNNTGITLNYTYSQSKSNIISPITNSALTIPGQSDHIFNAVAFYEVDDFSLSLSYNYRSEFFERLDRGNAVIREPLSEVDASISYNLNENLSFYVQGINLNNQIVKQYNTDSLRPLALRYIGRRYFAGFRFNF